MEWDFFNLSFLVLDTFVESVIIHHPLLCIDESATLECHVILNTPIGSDLSVLNISWYHNGTYLSASNIAKDDGQYLYTSTLYLISVNDTSGGEYTCKASIIENKTLVMDLINATVQGQHSIAIVIIVFS